jgi:hypothetical protein
MFDHSVLPNVRFPLALSKPKGHHDGEAQIVVGPLAPANQIVINSGWHPDPEVHQFLDQRLRLRQPREHNPIGLQQPL